ncbi:MAG: hypothetical protein HRU77_09775 [Gammaproteobacteria bacterium]|nr:MAG: hypothetical protein HRU77_09775 [Gammaproteobacteria bacterium]
MSIRRVELISMLWIISLLTLFTIEAHAGKPFEVDYPNIVRPIAQFGTYGSKFGEFNEPSGLFISRESEIYISDCHNQRIQVFSKRGEFKRAINLLNARCPQGIAVDEDSQLLFVSDTSHELMCKKSQGCLQRG